MPAQVARLGECRRSCVGCGSVLTSKGHYSVRFRSLLGDVPLRVRRLLTCPCQGDGEAKSSAVLDFDGNAVAPELTYLTARYAALAPFGKVAALLSEVLPMSGTQHASTVRNRTRRHMMSLTACWPVLTTFANGLRLSAVPTGRRRRQHER